jgi:adenine-specific DNA-methyltransferase
VRPADAKRRLSYLIAQYRESAATIAEGLADDARRKAFAESFCSNVLGHVWNQRVGRKKATWELEAPPVAGYSLDPAGEQLAADVAVLLSALDVATSDFLLGSYYASLLPPRVRSEWGVYYTPPALVQRLLSNATSAGLDWRRARVLDPACGGAAFLAPAALRIWQALSKQQLPPGAILDHIASHLSGVEIDPFAAWMSQALTEIRLVDLAAAAGRRLKPIVRLGDALQILANEPCGYDLVVGNPPYGKVTLARSMRKYFSRSVYGHANLYGLFTDLSLRITNAGGIVAFVTPTSFLSGQYFKALRSILATEAPPVCLDFVQQRDGVFEDVLQETVLVAFRKRNGGLCATKINTIHADRPNGGDPLISFPPCGTRHNFRNHCRHNFRNSHPRSESQGEVLRGATRMTSRLSQYGLRVVTGQLVWNRHKDQLRTAPTKRALPLVWAESVLPDGRFRFRALRGTHRPYVELRSGQEYLVTRDECLLVQRTTAKEQSRRLVCALLPGRFIRENDGGVVVENHLNIIRAADLGLLPRVPLEVLSTLLNSQVVDQVFRCISGSVAVSAYELNALPLPDADVLDGLCRLLSSDRPNAQEVEAHIAGLYGMN